MTHPLYDGTPPHEAASTSVAAAVAIEPNVNKLQRVVLEVITEMGSIGLTDEEGIDLTGLAANTWRPRRRELELLGLIRFTDEERLTRSGRRAKVWVSV